MIRQVDIIVRFRRTIVELGGSEREQDLDDVVEQGEDEENSDEE